MRSPGGGVVARFAPIARAAGWAMNLGVGRAGLVSENKRTRLAHLLALVGAALMTPWLVIEALFGNRAMLPLEAVLLGSFFVILTLNACEAIRTARLLLIVVANGCVFAGAVLYTSSAGGALPFFALVA